MTIPNNPNEITPQWLTAALRTAQVIQQAAVFQSEIEPLPSFTSQLLRLQLSYTAAEPGAPHTLLAKLPSADPARRQLLFTVTHHYQCEMAFFRQVVDRVPIRVPRCYYHAFDPAAQHGILLLEDLAPAHTLDSIQGCPPAAARSVFQELARLHAAWWRHPTLAELAVTSFDNPVFAQQIAQLYQQLWPAFLAAHGSHLPPAMHEVGQRLGPQLPWLYDQLQQGPQTLLHNDVQLGNLLFIPGGVDTTPPIFIDWQQMAVGRGAGDLAFLFCRDLLPAVRRQAEDGLLRDYWSSLVALGVNDYSFADCLRDFRLALLKSFSSLLVASMVSDPTDPNVRNTFAVYIPRCVTAVLDHNAGTLLPG